MSLKSELSIIPCAPLSPIVHISPTLLWFIPFSTKRDLKSSCVALSNKKLPLIFIPWAGKLLFSASASGILSPLKQAILDLWEEENPP